jgi:surfeit locus 1 family protein
VTLKARLAHHFNRPRFSSVLLLVLGLVFFIVLGNWQVSRARFKDALYASFAATSHAQGVTLAQALRRWPIESYVRVAITGQFIRDKTLLLDSQTANGHIGVQVFQAFKTQTTPTTSGTTVLVALGFIPIPPDRSWFPNPSVPSGLLHLQGVISAPPSSGIKLAEISAPPSTPNWLVTRIEPERFDRYFGANLPKAVVLLDPVEPAVQNATAPNSAINVLTLPRVWRPNTFGPERHRGYAATWYGFALTASIIFVLLHVKRTPQLRREPE